MADNKINANATMRCMEDHNYCQPSPAAGSDPVEVKLLCYLCGKECADAKSLKNHEYWKHSDREEKFQCSFCDKKFTMKCLKKRHEVKKHGPKIYPCIFCDKLFSDKWVKDKHQKIHSK